MKLLVLGATGKTGREVVAQALAAGHDVTAFVRDPAKLAKHEHLTMFVGNAEDQKQVEAAATGQNAVISVLGHTSAAKSTALTTATRALVKVLPPNTKVITLTGTGVPDPKDPQPSFAGRLLTGVIKAFPGEIYQDGARHVDLLRPSDLSWTVIRAAVLTGGPKTGKIELGYFKLSAKDTVSRADVAAAMLACLTDNKWKRQAPMIRRAKS